MGEFSSFAQERPRSAPTRSPPSGGEFSRFAGGPSELSIGGFHLPSAAYGAMDMASFGVGDEIMGGLAGAGAILGGGDFALAYRQRANESRQRLEEAQRLHPISTAVGQFAGAGATFMIPGAIAGAGARAAQAGGALARAGRAAEGVGNAGRSLLSGRALPAGERLTQWAAGTGPGALASQMALGAGQGAAYGALYGAGSANTDSWNPNDWGGNALKGALVGGAFGGLTPPIFQGLTRGSVGEGFVTNVGNALLRAGAGAAAGAGSSVFTGRDPMQSAVWGAGIGVGAKPALSAVGRNVGGPLLAAWRNPRRAFGEGAGMSLGLPPFGAAPAAVPRQKIPGVVLNRVEQGMRRSRMDLGEFERRLDEAQSSAPIGRRLVDVNDEFSADMDSLVSQTGQSRTRAVERQRELSGAFPQAMRADMGELLGVQKTPGEWLDDLRLAERSASDGYEQVLAQPVRQDVVRSRIAPLVEADEMQGALADRFAVEQGYSNLARIEGRPPPAQSVVRSEDGRYQLAENISGRQLHALKTSIDQHLDAAANWRALNPASRDRQGMLDNFRERFLSAVDDAVPGYGEVRAQRGSAYDLERALRLDRDGNPTVGARILRMDGQEAARFMRETTTPTGRRRPTTDIERDAYRADVLHELYQKVRRYISESQETVRNPGQVLTGINTSRDVLRAIFNDNPQGIDEFISRAIARADMLKRTSDWVGRSPTAPRASRAIDMVFDAATSGGDVVGHVMRGTAGRVWNALRNPMMEQERDLIGQTYLRSIERGAPEDELFVSDLREQLRRRAAERIERARNAGAKGVYSAPAGVDRGDDLGY